MQSPTWRSFAHMTFSSLHHTLPSDHPQSVDHQSQRRFHYRHHITLNSHKCLQPLFQFYDGRTSNLRYTIFLPWRPPCTTLVLGQRCLAQGQVRITYPLLSNAKNTILPENDDICVRNGLRLPCSIATWHFLCSITHPFWSQRKPFSLETICWMLTGYFRTAANMTYLKRSLDPNGTPSLPTDANATSLWLERMTKQTCAG
ncbi:hypothetical protein LZ32DRAFT_26791 [Colletotrichum eremochloae]|nr:hypothetical protein LZ32DRAFT_26791 [Colletotrichum eremochloae]